MAEETVHESRRARSRQAIATYFRRLSNRLRRGEPVPADDGQTITLDPPETPNLEVEVEREEGEISLEMEMAWSEGDDDVDTDAAASKATFERYEDSADEWRWRLVHNNGNIIADSGEGYSSKQNATQGLESVKTNAPGGHIVDLSKDESADDVGEDGSGGVFEVYEDSAGKWRWRLLHENGNIIADCGGGYSSKQKAKQGLNSVKTNAPGAPVEDVES
jgi:amphi-Trp domain-containing protein